MNKLETLVNGFKILYWYNKCNYDITLSHNNLTQKYVGVVNYKQNTFVATYPSKFKVLTTLKSMIEGTYNV